MVYYRPTPTSTSHTAALPIDGVPVDPVSSVRDLGIYIDAHLVMQTNVKKTASRCFAVLRQLCQIRRYVSTDTFRRWWSLWLSHD